MEITERSTGDDRILVLSGRLDAIAGPRLLETCTAGMGAGNLILDMKDVAYISSGGIRALLTIQKHRTAAGGRLVLAEVQAFVEDIFSMTGCDSLFSCAPSVDAAMALLSGEEP